MKKQDFYAIFGYTIAIMVGIFIIATVFHVVAWIFNSVLLGFFVALIMWVIKWIRTSETSRWYLVTWGIILSAAFIVVDVVKATLSWFGSFFWIILIAAILIWAFTREKKA
jgi:hypothetical protein